MNELMNELIILLPNSLSAHRICYVFQNILNQGNTSITFCTYLYNDFNAVWVIRMENAMHLAA